MWLLSHLGCRAAVRHECVVTDCCSPAQELAAMRWPRLPAWIESLLDLGFVPQRNRPASVRRRRRTSEYEPLEQRQMLTGQALYWVDGSGTWDQSPSNFAWSQTSGGGASQAWTNGNDAKFAGPGDTVSVASGVTASSLQVTSGNYTLADHSPLVAGTLAVGGSLGNPATLTIAASQNGAAPPTLYWDGGPSGTWNSQNVNWSPSPTGGNDVHWISGAQAIFGGTGVGITVADGISAAEVNFITAGYTLSGGTLDVTSCNVKTGAQATINTKLTGTSGLYLFGGGTLTVSGANNTYSGPTSIFTGTLKLGSSAALGQSTYFTSSPLRPGVLDLNGQHIGTTPGSGPALDLFPGTLINSSSTPAVCAANVNDQLNGSNFIATTLNVAGTGTITMSGVIDGTSSAVHAPMSVNKSGAGTLILTNHETYSGATSVNAGTLEMDSTGGFFNTEISVAARATFAVHAGSAEVDAGDNGTVSTNDRAATLTLNPGSTFDMRDGAAGTFKLQHQPAYNGGPQLTINNAPLGFDLSSARADTLATTGDASVSGVNTINITTIGSNLADGSFNLISAHSGLSGSFQFANGTSSETVSIGNRLYTLTLVNSDTGESVRVAAGPLDQESGNWLPGDGLDNLNQPYRQIAAGTGTTTWTFDNFSGGMGSSYQLFATWPARADATATATYAVTGATQQPASVTVNQQLPPDGDLYNGVYWKNLGTFTATNGSLSVTLSGAGSGLLLADQISLIPTAQTPSVSFGKTSGTIARNGPLGSGASDQIEVKLSAPSTETVTVQYQVIQDGTTANYGTDFNLNQASMFDPTQRPTGTLTFSPNTTTCTFTLNVLPMSVSAASPNQTVHLRLSNPSHAVLGGSGASDYIETIDNSQISEPLLLVGQPFPAEFRDGDTILIPVSLSAPGTNLNGVTPDPSAQPVTVDYQLSGSATSADYRLDSGMQSTGTLTFAPYSVVQYIPVHVLANPNRLSDITLTYTLSNPSGATLYANGYGASGTITIASDQLYELASPTVNVQPFGSIFDQPSMATLTLSVPTTEIETATIDVLQNRDDASADFFTTDRNVALSRDHDHGLLLNDADPAEDIMLVEPAHHGTATVASDGSFTYAPATNFIGIDTFSYKHAGDSEKATVTIGVGQGVPGGYDSLNPAPNRFSPATDNFYEVAKGTNLILDKAHGLLATDDLGPAVDSPRVKVVVGPQHGRLLMNVDGSFRYDPDPGFEGSDTFAYNVELDSTKYSVDYSLSGTGVAYNGTNYATADYAIVREDTGQALTNATGTLHFLPTQPSVGLLLLIPVLLLA